jgi:hypothetical protein
MLTRKCGGQTLVVACLYRASKQFLRCGTQEADKFVFICTDTFSFLLLFNKLLDFGGEKTRAAGQNFRC